MVIFLSLKPLKKSHISTQQEGGYVQAGKTAPTEPDPVSTLIPGFQPSGLLGNKVLLFELPVYSLLLRLLEQTKKISELNLCLFIRMGIIIIPKSQIVMKT